MGWSRISIPATRFITKCKMDRSIPQATRRWGALRPGVRPRRDSFGDDAVVFN
jgi:hypothetical protein